MRIDEDWFNLPSIFTAGQDEADEESVEEVVVYEEEEEESVFDDDMEVFSSATHEIVLLCQRHSNWFWICIGIGMKVELQPQERAPASNSYPGNKQFCPGQVLPTEETTASCFFADSDDASEQGAGEEQEQVELEQPDLLPEPLDSRKGTFKDFNLNTLLLYMNETIIAAGK